MWFTVLVTLLSALFAPMAFATYVLYNVRCGKYISPVHRIPASAHRLAVTKTRKRRLIAYDSKCICYKWNSYLDTIDAVDGATELCCQQVYHKAAQILDFTDAFCDVRNISSGWSACCESLGLGSSGSGGSCRD
ncbi:hypothetical protein F5Y18DRAFT_396384 [Xylariaceae sp. FL1019]|nr:hypothetical protein F5Y18DRAFT_396384 [Xylariaceae sp. FL1019]